MPLYGTVVAVAAIYFSGLGMIHSELTPVRVRIDIWLSVPVRRFD